MPDYKASYEREKKARKVAEKMLEDTSRELYLVNGQLKSQYDKMISEFKQKTLLLQISRYSQEHIKLSELLPDVIYSMLSMGTLPFGIFDYFPLDRQRDADAHRRVQHRHSRPACVERRLTSVAVLECVHRRVQSHRHHGKLRVAHPQQDTSKYTRIPRPSSVHWRATGQGP